MKIVLFDSILERHLVESLERALKYLGCEVITTGLILHGHSMIKKQSDIDKMWEELAKIETHSPDLLISFRPMNLLPEMLDKIRKNMLTAVWLSDDPVLYKVCYGEIASHYDILLHCGSEKVINFYTEKGHSHGLNFPFWTDHHAFPAVYSHNEPNIDVVFLGNMHDQVRKKRYFEFSSLPFSSKVFGLVDSDPLGIHGGFIKDAYLHCDLVSDVLAKAKIGLSIPQFFTEYKELHYYFEGLSDLGYFQFPSRVIQYAASGLPIAAIGGDDMKQAFPEIEVGNSIDGLIPYISKVISDKEYAVHESRAVLSRFRRNYSSLSRAMMLLDIVQNHKKILKSSASHRANVFLEYSANYNSETY